MGMVRSFSVQSCCLRFTTAMAVKRRTGATCLTPICVLLLISLNLNAEAQSSYHDIRLVDKNGTANSAKGRLEVLVDGQWGTVCFHDFELTEANVACRQLGYEGAAYYDIVKSLMFAKAANPNLVPMLLDDVWCEPIDASLQDCSHSGVGNHNCLPHEAVGLVCLTNGTLRLAHDVYFGIHGHGQGEKPFGRLEVYLNGQWGTICGTGFEDREADVACKSLGFKHSVFLAPFYYFQTSLVSEGIPIWLENVRCSANHSTLLDCDHNSIGENNTCSHWDDVALECAIEDIFLDYYIYYIIIVIGVIAGTLPTIIIPTVICCCIAGCIYHSKKNSITPKVVNTPTTGAAYPLQANNLQQPRPYPTQQPVLYPSQGYPAPYAVQPNL